MEATNNSLPSSVLRIIDANLNRLKEGIRVLEDIERYYFERESTALSLKKLRHQATLPNNKELLESRDIINDCLKTTIDSETKRESLESIQWANFQRTQESSRVLEEIFKLSDPTQAESFKQLRYALYDLEKQIMLQSQ